MGYTNMKLKDEDKLDDIDIVIIKNIILPLFGRLCITSRLYSKN